MPTDVLSYFCPALSHKADAVETRGAFWDIWALLWTWMFNLSQWLNLGCGNLCRANNLNELSALITYSVGVYGMDPPLIINKGTAYHWLILRPSLDPFLQLYHTQRQFYTEISIYPWTYNSSACILTVILPGYRKSVKEFRLHSLSGVQSSYWQLVSL